MAPGQILEIGDVVRFTDPDMGVSSGIGEVEWVQHTPLAVDTIVTLKMPHGGEVECLPHELELMVPPIYMEGSV